MTPFPAYVSFTVTNSCNLRCRMCGQWSEHGYIANPDRTPGPQMELAHWKRLADESADHGIKMILIRGGEPFLYPDIIPLLEHLHDRGLFIAIDTNGTLLKKAARDLVRIGGIHVTVSVDGPEPVHDQVRGVPGTFRKLEEGLKALAEAEKANGSGISKSICFTISPYSVNGLGVMPAVARSLGIGSLSIVPYCYIPEAHGKAFEQLLFDRFDCRAFSWRGFRHDTSGVDTEVFAALHREYLEDLGNLHNYPYLPLSGQEYRDWFKDAAIPVGPASCASVEQLIDIQPNGDVNFCVDIPDYSFGNARQSTLKALWNSPEAERFRIYRRETPLPACHRCVAKYIAVKRD